MLPYIYIYLWVTYCCPLPEKKPGQLTLIQCRHRRLTIGIESLSALAMFLFVFCRELSRRADNSVSVLQELRVERASQKHILLGKLRYIRKDVEWDLRKIFGSRVTVKFDVIVGR